MRVIRLRELGPPLEVLHLEEVATPEPGPGQLRLRMTHRPINPSDLHSISGLYPVRPRLPGSPGLEGVGRYDLADFTAAIAHAERPGRHGKVLLVG